MNRIAQNSLFLLGLTFLIALASLPSAATAAPPSKNKAFAKVQDDPKLPRVLLIGDSISIGYTLPVRAALAGKANVHRPAANCGWTGRGVDQIDAWLGSGKWDLIHFNWGLHDLKYIEGKHQVPLDQYEKNLQQLVTRMKKTGATLVWCTTTPVPENVTPKRVPDDVAKYNAAAARVMKEHNVATNDLYSFALKQLDQIQRPQNVHFSPEGSKVLASEVARQIESHLSKE